MIVQMSLKKQPEADNGMQNWTLFKVSGCVVIGAEVRGEEFVELYVHILKGSFPSQHFRPLFPCARHKGARQLTGTFHFKTFSCWRQIPANINVGK